MRINWKIDKKRGNNRPSLTFTIVLEDFERELAVDSVNILTTLPKIENSNQAYCLPGCNERAADWQPLDFHWFTTPYFRDGRREGFIRLPFRESGEYPEVRESFDQLKTRYEELVTEAYRWSPLDKSGELDLSDSTRQAIAATLTARKLQAFM